MEAKSENTIYRGRFAPSPTGPLHFGSLVTALGSYLDAKSNNGEWLVRIEDLDPPREVPGAARDVLVLLEKLGMEWDGEVVYQSQRHDFYRAALAKLKKQALIYPCFCSRKQVAASRLTGIDGPVYAGTCRSAPGKDQNSELQKRSAVRVKTDMLCLELTDRVQGFLSQCIGQDIGDFVLRRADGVFAYQLAVVVDDADQCVTHVVRGADLLDSTPRQIFLQQLLGYPVPAYMHLPLVTNQRGEKLSKQTFAAPVRHFDVLSQLMAALRFLGQNPPQGLLDSNLETFWQWAVLHWQTDSIPSSVASGKFTIK
ncbi:glutamyl-Q tRNA(Asp) synthetase [Nitrosomonas marina]|uniref:Glutamyl-Q tRNA(Asp) synthetase n=1 Tax=Nitrosomonas marina TaxID=917 RepID=A0A1I0FS06_9PROT|nr:tRNA glutamyl-Q(34) synthetase GluQRS [Nitrosomonas marina]SET60325.1 glutamyl-Q tRNA(Asp) synthetase [Nitrosomonas marina]